MNEPSAFEALKNNNLDKLMHYNYIWHIKSIYLNELQVKLLKLFGKMCLVMQELRLLVSVGTLIQVAFWTILVAY